HAASTENLLGHHRYRLWHHPVEFHHGGEPVARYTGGRCGGNTDHVDALVAGDSPWPFDAGAWSLTGALPCAAGGHHHWTISLPVRRTRCAWRNHFFSSFMVDNGSTHRLDLHADGTRRCAGTTESIAADVVGSRHPHGPICAARCDDGRRWASRRNCRQPGSPGPGVLVPDA